jgi:hypothetical protein
MKAKLSSKPRQLSKATKFQVRVAIRTAVDKITGSSSRTVVVDHNMTSMELLTELLRGIGIRD